MRPGDAQVVTDLRPLDLAQSSSVAEAPCYLQGIAESECTYPEP